MVCVCACLYIRIMCVGGLNNQDTGKLVIKDHDQNPVIYWIIRYGIQTKHINNISVFVLKAAVGNEHDGVVLRRII